MSQTNSSEVYVVGGLPRTGKTTLASKLASSIGMPNIETDHIRTLFNARPNNKISFTRGADIPIVTKKLRPYLESLIEGFVHSGQSCVLNGEAIDPHMVSESGHGAFIKSCFLGLDNADMAFERIRTIADPADWAMQKGDTELRRILHHYAQRSAKLREQCEEAGLVYIDASLDFNMAQTTAASYLGYAAVAEVAVGG